MTTRTVNIYEYLAVVLYMLVVTYALWLCVMDFMGYGVYRTELSALGSAVQCISCIDRSRAGPVRPGTVYAVA